MLLDFFPYSKSLLSQFNTQFNRFSCSAASLVMVLNSLRVPTGSRISEEDLINLINVENWKKKLSPDGHEGEHGVHLASYLNIILAAFQAFGFKNAKAEIVYIDAVSEDSTQNLKKALGALSKEVYMIANFDQKMLLGASHAGHFSPIGAYDPIQDKVLVLDPDHEACGPYWAPVQALIEGMATAEPFSGRNRGFILIDLGSESDSYELN